MAPRRRRGLAPAGKALLDDPQLRLGRPPPAPPELHHLEPLNLRTVLTPIHKDSPHPTACYRKAALTAGLPSSPTIRDLAGFDFKAQPSLDPKQIRDLATGRFIANGETLLLLGPPGVGKTHLAVALGRAAILAGYAVLFIQATTLVAALARAHGEGRLEDKLTQFAKPRLLIVDELGYLPFEPDAAHLFFQLVPRRYERGSLLITSNRAIGEWGTVFGDPVVATAILDRLLHHSHVVTIRGDSYRLREKRRSGLLKATSEPRALAPTA